MKPIILCTLLAPQATIPVALVNAGVDRVCSDPEAFAADASAVEQAIRQLENFKR